ncbi:hypothetical protein C8F01DRAFT_1076876 [Mycena amicta]|nr:hypothetical protein C8F01DRAFT_1076876 [Mycena amicta]
MFQLRAQIKSSAHKEAAMSTPKCRGRLSTELLRNTNTRTTELPLDPTPIPSQGPAETPNQGPAETPNQGPAATPNQGPAATPHASDAAAAAVLESLAESMDVDVRTLMTLMSGLSKLVMGDGAGVVVSPRKTRAVKAKAAKKKQVQPQDKNMANAAHSMLRKATYTLFAVEQGSDFIFHASASPREVEAFANDEGTMPDTLAQRDFNPGYLDSAWNAVQKERIIDEVVRADKASLQLIDKGHIKREYLEYVLSEQLERIRGDWNQFQTKYNAEAGRMETKTEAYARAKFVLLQRRAASRRVNAQHAKFQRRVHTVEATIYLKEADGAKDLATWKRMLEILEYLGPSGMSEEEESYIMADGAKVMAYKIKLCVWREPSVADFMRMVDAQAKRIEDVHGGNKAAVRVWCEEPGHREPPPGLPRCLYNGKWLESKSTVYQQELRVSEKVFALFMTATQRME